MVFLFLIPFGPMYHTRTFIRRLKITIVSIWLRMVLTQIITQVCKDSQFDISTKYQYLSGITILIPMGMFLDAIIDADYQYPCIPLYTKPTLVLMNHFLSFGFHTLKVWLAGGSLS